MVYMTIMFLSYDKFFTYAITIIGSNRKNSVIPPPAWTPPVLKKILLLCVIFNERTLTLARKPVFMRVYDVGTVFAKAQSVR